MSDASSMTHASNEPATHGPTARSLTWAMALFLLLNGFVLNGVIWLATPPPHQETVLDHSWDVLHGRGSDDSWGLMKQALAYLKQGGPRPLYSEIFFERAMRFQYPPSSLFALAAMLAVAGPTRVRTDEFQQFAFPSLNDILGWVFLLMTGAAAATLLELGLRKRQLPGDSAALIATRVVIVAGLTLTFYPVVKAYTLGQIQVWINGLFALALLAWAVGLKATSG